MADSPRVKHEQVALTTATEENSNAGRTSPIPEVPKTPTSAKRKAALADDAATVTRSDTVSEYRSDADSLVTPSKKRNKVDEKPWNWTHVPITDRSGNGRTEGRNLIAWTRG